MSKYDFARITFSKEVIDFKYDFVVLKMFLLIN